MVAGNTRRNGKLVCGRQSLNRFKKVHIETAVTCRHALGVFSKYGARPSPAAAMLAGGRVARVSSSVLRAAVAAPGDGRAPSVFQRVPDVLRLAEINHFLGDVLGVVGDAFQALRGDDPMQATPDGSGVFGHVLRERLMNFLIERV